MKFLQQFNHKFINVFKRLHRCPLLLNKVCIVLRLNLNCASNLWSISSEIVRPLCLMKRGPFRSEFLVFASFSKMFTLLFLCSLKEGAKNILKHGWWSHLKKVTLWQSFVLERLTVIFSDLPGHVSLGNLYYIFEFRSSLLFHTLWFITFVKIASEEHSALKSAKGRNFEKLKKCRYLAFYQPHISYFYLHSFSHF